MIYINIAGIGILIIFLLFILPKKKKTTSDYLLILTISLFGAMLLSDILIRQGLSAPKYLFQMLSTTLLFPSFLLYGMVLVDKEHRLKWSWWWVPSYTIVFVVFLFIDFVYVNDYNTVEKVDRLYRSPTAIYQFFYKAQYLFIILAMTWFLRKLNRYSKKIKDYYSFIEPIHLNWFRNFTLVFLILEVLSLVLFLSLDFGLLNDINIPFTIVYSGIVLALFYLCYHGIKQYAIAEFKGTQNSIAKNRRNTNGTLEVEEAADIKYKSSSLSESEMNALFNEIKCLFEVEKVYLEPQLKIQTLSEHLGATTHKISQTINTKAEKSFYDYVNDFRVAHLKSLLAIPENQKYTILALGIESGFNSKATLNRTFKQHMGISPKQFQKAHFTG